MLIVLTSIIVALMSACVASPSLKKLDDTNFMAVLNSSVPIFVMIYHSSFDGKANKLATRSFAGMATYTDEFEGMLL